MAAHRLTMDYQPGGWDDFAPAFAATCSCGWLGDWATGEDAHTWAVEDGTAHLND